MAAYKRRGRPPIVYENLLTVDETSVEEVRLAGVITVAEVMETWGHSRHKVLMDIERGGLLAHKCGNVHVISLLSACRLYNKYTSEGDVI